MGPSDIFTASISLQTARVSAPGFGVIMLLSHSAAWIERVRSYGSLAAVAADWGVTTPEYRMAQAIFLQDRVVQLLKIGRCANVPTERWAITPVAADATAYKLTVVGTDQVEHAVTYTSGSMLDLPYTSQTANFTAGKTVTGGSSGAKAIILSDTDGGTSGTLRVVGVRGTFTATETITDNNGTPGSATLGTPAAVTGASATAAEIINGLRSLVDALGLALTLSDQTTYLRVLANTAGAFFGLYVDNVARLGIAMDHADPGMAADLAAIQLEDPLWYSAVDPFPSAAVVSALALFASTNTKLCVADTQDSEVATHVLSGATDIAATLKTAAYLRASAWYHGRAHEFLAAALLGRVYPIDPGRVVFGGKTLVGITPDALTDAQRANVQAKYGNTYESIDGSGRTHKGKVAGNEWMDIIRDRDWQVADMALTVYSDVASADKIPFTNKGISIICADMRASLSRGVARGFLGDDPGRKFIVNQPKVSDISDADRAARNLPVTFSAFIAGAIQGGAFTGTLTV